MTPFVPAELPDNFKSPEAYMKSFNVDADTARRMVRVAQRGELFINDTYQVNRSPAFHPPGDWPWPPMLHLSIKRIDKQVIRDWRELQEIKNILVGPENEAIEVYPAESRLVDMANQFHLWVLIDPRVRFPVGWTTRMVFDEVHAARLGATQRPRNLDTLTQQELKDL